MKTFAVTFFLLLNFLCLPAAWSTTVLPISLQQLSTRATLIFYAETVNNTVKKDEHSGHIATFTEFKIIDLIKGDAGDSYTIKQIGGHLEGSSTILRVHGIPEFHVGKKYVVFLPEKSRLGFSSPLGLHQGRFSVATIGGQQVVSNGRSPANQTPQDNNNLQIPLAVSVDRPAQSYLGDFINTVRAYNTPQ